MLAQTTRGALVGAVVLLSVAVTGHAARGAFVRAASAVAISSAAYPRLANYNGYTEPTQAAVFARYNLVIAWDSLTSNDPQAVQALRALNPRPTILAYERAAQVDEDKQNRYGTNAIYRGWWLLKAGSTLSSNVNSSQTSISVASTAPFHSGDDVLLDDESMHITGINSGARTLTVQRGVYSTAASHSGGARIATHAFLDPGGPDGGHPWGLNMSSVCPKNAQGQRWVDFLASWIKTNVMNSGLWDGLFYDNTNDKLYDNSIDVNNDGKGDGGFINNVNVWQQGIAALFSETRANAPTAIIMGNGTVFSNYDTANGQEFYSNSSVINDPVKYSAYLANYYYHEMAHTAPSINLLDPYTPSGPWNLQLMRFGLTTALLSNGLYTYDKGATQNGTPWWFDEYDNGAGSALTANIGSGDTQLHVAHGNLFHSGDTVIVEGELMQVTGVSSSTLNVTRGYNGTTTESHDAGAVVATPQQVRQGLGYLGRPISLPHVVSGSTTNLLPAGSFNTSTLAPWSLNVSTPAVASAAVQAASGGAPSAAAVVTVTAIDGNDQDVSLQDAAFSLSGGHSYTVGFVARSTAGHYAHLLICAQATNPQCFVDAELGLRSKWTLYVLHFTMPATASDTQVRFGLGDVPAVTAFSKAFVAEDSQPVQRRDFTNGMVLVNASPVNQTVTLPAGYCHLQGDQNPTLNNGAPASTVTIPSRDGVILRRCAGSSAPPAAGSASRSSACR